MDLRKIFVKTFFCMEVKDKPSRIQTKTNSSIPHMFTKNNSKNWLTERKTNDEVFRMVNEVPNTIITIKLFLFMAKNLDKVYHYPDILLSR